MAFVDNQGARIYWDEQGQGEPVWLIMGLGYPSAMWYRIRPALAARYRTIVLDNRGAGLSDTPPGPYPIPQMASDAAAVLDAAGVESAHVFGVSMGGMIAQEFALQYSQRVLSLILGCTAAGGPTAVRAEPAAIQMLMTRGKMSAEEAAEAAVPFIYDRATPREWIDEDLAVRRPWFPSPEGYAAQLQGILAWAAYSRLGQIVASSAQDEYASERCDVTSDRVTSTLRTSPAGSPEIPFRRSPGQERRPAGTPTGSIWPRLRRPLPNPDCR